MGCTLVNSLHLFCDPRGREYSHQANQLHALIIQGYSKHLQVLETLAFEEAFGDQGSIHLFIKHGICKDRRGNFDLSLAPWGTLKALPSDGVVFNSFHYDSARLTMLVVESCEDLHKAVLLVSVRWFVAIC